MSSSASYRRVSQREDGNTNNNANNRDMDTSRMRSRTERLTDKVTALAWIVTAIIVARWSSFFSVLWTSEEANRFLLRLAALGLGISTSLVLYLIVYLPKVKKLNAESAAWNVYCPKVVPILTTISILSYLLALRGTWAVWGFLSPIVYGTQLMGALMALHFVPCW